MNIKFSDNLLNYLLSLILTGDRDKDLSLLINLILIVFTVSIFLWFYKNLKNYLINKEANDNDYKLKAIEHLTELLFAISQKKKEVIQEKMVKASPYLLQSQMKELINWNNDKKDHNLQSLKGKIEMTLNDLSSNYRRPIYGYNEDFYYQANKFFHKADTGYLISSLIIAFLYTIFIYLIVLYFSEILKTKDSLIYKTYITMAISIISITIFMKSSYNIEKIKEKKYLIVNLLLLFFSFGSLFLLLLAKSNFVLWIIAVILGVIIFIGFGLFQKKLRKLKIPID